MSANGNHQDIWQKDIPDGVPFEVELREDGPKTVAMKKGGTFDKWKAGIPRSNPLHQGGSNDIEFVWLMLISNHLRDELRINGGSRVTIVATGSGDSANFQVTKGWTGGPAGSAGQGAEGQAANGGRNGRVGRPLPGEVTSFDYLVGLLRATAFAHQYLRDSKRIARIAADLPGEGRSSFEATILIQAGKVAFSAALAALDSGQDFNAQLKAIVQKKPSDVPAATRLPEGLPEEAAGPLYSDYPSEPPDDDQLPF